MTLTTRGYALGQFEFSLDDQSLPFLVKAVEGGLAKGNTVEESIGTGVEVVKHISTVEIEPVSIELTMQDSLPIMKWIQQSWNMDYARKSGSVKHADANMKATYEYTFKNALVTEVTFPSLDAAGKEQAVLKVKMQPETTDLKVGDRARITPQSEKFDKQKLWNVSCFELELDGLDVKDTAKIDGFTVKQSVKPMYHGRARYPEWEPTKLTFPDLSAHIALAKGKDVIDWWNRMVATGGKDPALEREGAIHFLAPNKTDIVFTIKLHGVGIKAISIDKSERNDQTKRVKFDMYLRSMELVMSGGLATK